MDRVDAQRLGKAIRASVDALQELGQAIAIEQGLERSVTLACGCQADRLDSYTHESEHARELGHGIHRTDTHSATQREIECDCGFKTGRVLLSMAMTSWREHVLGSTGAIRIKHKLDNERGGVDSGLVQIFEAVCTCGNICQAGTAREARDMWARHSMKAAQPEHKSWPATMPTMACGCEASGLEIDFKHECDHAKELGHELYPITEVEGGWHSVCSCHQLDFQAAIKVGVVRQWRAHVLLATGLGAREPEHQPETYYAEPRAESNPTVFVRCSCGWGASVGVWHQVSRWADHIKAEREKAKPLHTFKGFMFSAEGVTATCECGWSTIGESKANARVAWQSHAGPVREKEGAKPMTTVEGKASEWTFSVDEDKDIMHAGGLVPGLKSYVLHRGEGHLTQQLRREVHCPNKHTALTPESCICSGTGRLIEHLTVTMDIDSDSNIVVLLAGLIAKALKVEGFDAEPTPTGEAVRAFKDKILNTADTSMEQDPNAKPDKPSMADDKQPRENQNE